MKKIRNAVDAECRETVRLDRPHTPERAYRDGSVRRAISGWPVLRLSRPATCSASGRSRRIERSLRLLCDEVDRFDPGSSSSRSRRPSQTPEKLPSRRRSQLLVDRDKPSGHCSVEP